VTAHPTRTDGVWRVMRFETKTGNYAELASNQVGPEAVPIPPGYQLVSVTPMVTAAEAEELRDALVPFAFIGRASLGVADVVAMRRVDVPPGLASEVRLFEVKSTAGGPWERFGPSSRALLSAAAARAGATAWLAYKPPRGSWLFVPEEQWPVWRAAA
jgi:hypothetical protein